MHLSVLLDQHISFFSSIVYKIESGARLTIHQQIPTLGGTDVTTFKIGGDTYLAIASSRDDVANYDQDVVVYAWNSLTELFEIIQHIPSRNVQTLHAFVMPSKIGMSKARNVINFPSAYTNLRNLDAFLANVDSNNT